MMRSLFSGVAGLRTHQTRMDVIGNNIANVNTVAYKAQNATFQELMYQTTSNASGANAETGRGGVNAKQIGLGTSVAAINTNIETAGASQSTGNAFDIQISGSSFFVVSDGASNFFTRAGAFTVDGAGNLVMTSNGFIVQGWQPNEATEEDPDDAQVDMVSDLKIMSPENMVSDPERTEQAYVGGVIDKNDKQLATDSGRPINVSVYDSLGYSYVVQLALKDNGGADNGQYALEVSKILDSKGHDILNGYDDEDGNPVAGSVTATLGKTGLEYDVKTGKYKGDKEDVVLTFGGTPQALNGEVKIDFSTSTMFDNNGTSTVAGHAGSLTGANAGRKKGALSGVAVQQDGKIYGTYDNGTTKLLGQIAVANFANPSGLEKVGDNLYSPTQNSGDFDGIGQDITADGSGKMSTGVLEMSNVDLSAEFTDMITTQRGFQANSRIITVSDTMLEELINLKR